MKYVKRSFYRYIGYFLAVLFISYVLSIILNFLGIKQKNLFIDDTYAVSSSQGWYFPDDFHYQGVFSQSSLNNSTSTEFNSTYLREEDNTPHIAYFLSISSLGRYISIYHPVMNNNFAYMIAYYFCTTSGDLPTIDKVYFGSTLTNVQDDLAYQLTRRKLSPKPLSNTTLGTCFVHTVKTEVSGGGRNVTTLHFSSAIPGGLYFMGYEFYPLGNSGSALSNVASQITSVSGNITNMESNINNKITSSQNTIISNQNSNTQVQIQNANSNQQQTNQGLSNINSNITETNDLIKDDNIDNSSGDDFFDSISTNQHGITAVLTAPLSFIQSFATESCSPISASVFGKDFTIPCMKQKEISFLGQDFYNIIVILVNGPLVYAICTYFVKSVKHAQDPDDDRIEVAEL